MFLAAESFIRNRRLCFEILTIPVQKDEMVCVQLEYLIMSFPVLQPPAGSRCAPRERLNVKGSWSVSTRTGSVMEFRTAGI